MGIKTFNRPNPVNKQIEVYNDFSGGINTELSDSAMEDNEFRTLVNFDIDAGGALIKRPGLYRMPYVKELIDYRINQICKDKVVFDGYDADGNKVPTDNAFNIEDCEEFFDGAHWVINYITNKGLFTLLLDKDLNVPSIFGDLDNTTPQERENILNKIIQFYPYGDGNVATLTSYKVKISAYNDTFIMIYSYFAAKPAIEDIDDNNEKRQVAFFSWNPIFAKKTEETPEIAPRWIEAKSDPNEPPIEYVSYGKEENITISSNSVKDVITSVDDQILNVSVEDQFGITKSWEDSACDWEVVYDNDKQLPSQAAITIRRRLKKPGATWEDFKVFLYHQNGEGISPQNVKQVIITSFFANQDSYYYDDKDALLIKVYLDTPIKYEKSFYFEAKSDAARRVVMDNIYWLDVSVGSFHQDDKFYSELQYYVAPQQDLANGNIMFGMNIPNSFNPQYNVRSSYVPFLNPGEKPCRANEILLTQHGIPYYYYIESRIPERSNSFDDWIRIVPYNHLFSIYNPFGSSTGKQVFEIKQSQDPTQDQWYGKETEFYTNSGSKYDLMLSAYAGPKELNSAGKMNYRHTTTDFKFVGMSYGFPQVSFKSWWPRENYPSEDRYYTRLQNFLPDVSTKVVDGETKFVYDKTQYFSVPNGLQDTDYKNSIYDASSFNNFLNFDKEYIRPGQGLSSFGVNAGISFWNMGHKLPNEYYKNRHVDGKFFLGSTGCILNLQRGSQSERVKIELGRIIENDFAFYTITQDNAEKLLMDYDGENSLPNYKQYLELIRLNSQSLFGAQGIQQCSELFSKLQKNLLVSLEFFLGYKQSSDGYLNTILTKLKPYELEDFLRDIIANKNCFLLKAIKFDNTLRGIVLYWESRNGLVELASLTAEEFSKITNIDFVLSNMRFYFKAKYLTDGAYQNVLSFKQLDYTIPNLNDLSAVGYNWANFNVYQKSTYPNIYDTKKYQNISNKLVSYPISDVKGSANSIQLFGIVPVNDIILQPGKQRFQLFYNVLNNDLSQLDNYIIAITGMDVSAYTAMINSPDYSTEGGSEDNPKISPNWVAFKDVFLSKEDGGYDDDPVFKDSDGNVVGKPAVFEWDIPATSSPYLLLIQVAQKQTSDDPNAKPKPRLATVVETRIEMQPGTSQTIKINMEGIFNEFTTTKYLSSYASNLIMFGSSNRLFFSDVANPSYYPLTYGLQVKTAEKIKSATLFQNKLVIATDNTRWYIGGSSFDSETDPIYLASISTDSGILAPKSDVPLGNYLYFLDNSGIKLLKNLYGTADKEFSYEVIDKNISSIVGKDEKACGVAFENKYYLCFPNLRIILIFNPNYKSWTMYQSELFDFVKMYVNDGKLYGIHAKNFNIYRFDKNVYVDDWNELQDNPFKVINNKDGTSTTIQNGTPIKCVVETKCLDQAYTPHPKKYDYALIEASIGGELEDEFGNPIKMDGVGQIIPYIEVDKNLINYKFSTYINENKVYNYIEDSPDFITLRDDSTLNNVVVDSSTLGDNSLNSFYYLPIHRKGNTISFRLEYNNATKFRINSISLRYALRDIKFKRKGIS